VLLNRVYGSPLPVKVAAFCKKYRKMQENARKICIYQNKVVLLHRQNKLRGRMTAEVRLLFYPLV
jgi:hypothetical protein